MNKSNYKKYSELIRKYIYDNYKLMFRKPDGIIYSYGKQIFKLPLGLGQLYYQCCPETNFL